MSQAVAVKCDCGNDATPEVGDGMCDYCAFAASQPPHKFRVTLFGTHLCVTCGDSPYCELL